jgi:ornithine carbamoyltransferase
MRNFISIHDLGFACANKILARALEMKKNKYRSRLLEGKVIALIFEKASTRTRVSFAVGIRQLGGSTLLLTPAESQLGRAEPLRDTARVLSRYCDGLVVRTFGQAKLEELMAFGSIPVINALTDEGHPCQVLSDILTIYERTPDFSKLRVSWIGDGHNMARSWMEAAIYYPFELFMACPKGYEPDSAYVDACGKAGARIFLCNDPRLGIAGAHYVNTDVWSSMGQEEEQLERVKAFKDFCVDEELMALAHPEAKFLHCLPAHRGEEVSEAVFEGENSLVFDEAENRLHMQKALMEWVFGDN